jgi:hypothetical protein
MTVSVKTGYAPSVPIGSHYKISATKSSFGKQMTKEYSSRFSNISIGIEKEYLTLIKAS